MWSAATMSSRRLRVGVNSYRANLRRDGVNPKKIYMNNPDGPQRGPSCPGLPMTDAPFRSTRAYKRDVSADGEAGLFRTMVGLWPYIWPRDRRDLQLRVWLAMALLLFAKLATIAVPFTFKWATDALVGEGSGPVAPSSWLTWALAAPILMTGAYGGTRILMAVLTQLRDGLFAKVAMHAVRRLAYLVFEHMHLLSLRFHLERKTGGLTRVLERGRNAIETIVRMVIMQLVPTALELSLIVAVLLYQFDWRYVVVILVTVACYMLFTYFATEWRINIRRRMNDSDTDANVKAIDSLLNYETVKYFVAEEREAARYDRAMERYEKASVEAYVSLAVLNAGQATIFTIGLAAAMVMCAYGIKDGTHTVGDFVMINAMMIQLYQPLNFMGMVYREIKQAVIDIETMFAILGRKPEIEDRPGATPLKVSDGMIRFENVSFAYAERQILKGLSFAVPAGKTIAIVGPSGAGKSTISRLIFRFYDATGGRIEIDGQDVRDVTQRSLRAAIGMVPQDTVLFNDTIRYNIRYGRWEATDAEVEEAARLAQIDGFIRLSPKGYETEVGERGLKLSGGEKQRVAIARTILKGPPILLLDEATSALDSHTEKDIQDALDRVAKNRTTLVIAHRLSTIVGADEIIVLDQGVIAERGTHHELLARRGLYASMWNRQREAEAAREKLALIGEGDAVAPNRNPPPVNNGPAADADAPVQAAEAISSAQAAE
jgi:ATP-binding cassette, subfamily B, heavy metal transporter